LRLKKSVGGGCGEAQRLDGLDRGAAGLDQLVSCRAPLAEQLEDSAMVSVTAH
jgi:hypothetical protein